MTNAIYIINQYVTIYDYDMHEYDCANPNKAKQFRECSFFVVNEGICPSQIAEVNNWLAENGLQILLDGAGVYFYDCHDTLQYITWDTFALLERISSNIHFY